MIPTLPETISSTNVNAALAALRDLFEGVTPLDSFTVFLRKIG
jgi:hypothetical protein